MWKRRYQSGPEKASSPGKLDEVERNPRKMNLDEIKGRYPAEKPVCFNYMQAREDVFALCKAVERQADQLQELEIKIRMATPSER